MKAGEILELNMFVAVGRTGRFAAAAVQLSVTPSAVSQSIRRHEARLGTRLFSRTTRSVSLTEAGQTLLAEVGPALDALSLAERTLIAGQRQSVGKARLSVSTVAMELLLAPVVADFRQAYSGFHLDIVVEDRLTDQIAQHYDAVIRRGDLLEQDMIGRRLSGDDRLILVASDAWAAGRPPPVHPRDLAPDRIVIRRPRSGAILPWSIARADEAITLRGSSGLIVEQATAARQYALNGLGVALLAHNFVSGFLDNGQLQWILPEWSAPLAGFYMMYAHRGHLAPPLEDLIRRMQASAPSPP
ncbi:MULTISPECIES: LysR family transcriptional regulator [unclassified Novosphingobium]|uniref:LysR family transcriptional regulator n=1 Tax=unclassified Novosphingobium TaxID=2644732 RepID=UPI001357F8E7|nr:MULTISPECIES: LysR family transcriptional regulator [unclassified Novosphingobium]